ncbi:hypothetical protein VINI7043_06610 [Vibrio nigripulchritudo ATCC 27043]|nr:hypothetical protein VINI7043_06610 [Vibrio nigripulchritudo ATCC 27043]
MNYLIKNILRDYFRVFVLLFFSIFLLQILMLPKLSQLKEMLIYTSVKQKFLASRIKLILFLLQTRKLLVFRRQVQTH